MGTNDGIVNFFELLAINALANSIRVLDLLGGARSVEGDLDSGRAEQDMEHQASNPYNLAIQPDDLDLRRHEVRASRRRLERAGDHEVILALQLVGFAEDSPEWIELATALIEYGYSVFKGWLIVGIAKRKAAEHANGRGVYGIGKLPDGLKLDPDEAHEVSVALMYKTLKNFRNKALMNPDPSKRWSPSGGAALKSFFVGQGLMDLPDVYTKWSSDKQKTARAVPAEDWILAESVNPDASNPEFKIMQTQRIEARMASLPELTQAMLELHAAGWNYEEIAEALSTEIFELSASKVRTDISRAKNTTTGATE